MSSRPTRASSTPSSACGAARNPSPSPSATWAEVFRGWARRPADAALALLLAPRCVACGEWLQSATSGPVCEACWGEVRFFTAPLCDVCGAPVAGTTRSSSPASCTICAREPLRHVSRAAALGAHEGSLRRIVHGFKFGRCPTLAAPLARLMRERHPGILTGAECRRPSPPAWREAARARLQPGARTGPPPGTAGAVPHSPPPPHAAASHAGAGGRQRTSWGRSLRPAGRAVFTRRPWRDSESSSWTTSGRRARRFRRARRCCGTWAPGRASTGGRAGDAESHTDCTS